jgi:hypothetical protein
MCLQMPLRSDRTIEGEAVTWAAERQFVPDGAIVRLGNRESPGSPRTSGCLVTKSGHCDLGFLSGFPDPDEPNQGASNVTYRFHAIMRKIESAIVFSDEKTWFFVIFVLVVLGAFFLKGMGLKKAY